MDPHGTHGHCTALKLDLLGFTWVDGVEGGVTDGVEGRVLYLVDHVTSYVGHTGLWIEYRWCVYIRVSVHMCIAEVCTYVCEKGSSFSFLTSCYPLGWVTLLTAFVL